jgi:hypothetical protein
MRDSVLVDGPDLRTWRAQCGICRDMYEHTEPSEDNPYPHGAFCPTCQGRGLMAPGVLHFKPRREKFQ